MISYSRIAFNVLLCLIVVLPCGSGVFAKPVVQASKQMNNNLQRGSQETPMFITLINPDGKVLAQKAEEERGERNFHENLVFLVSLIAIGSTLWQAHISGSIAKRQLRAYVFNVDSCITEINTPGSREAEIGIKNTGQTPAYDVIHWGGMWVFDFPLKSILPFPTDIIISKTHLAPGGECVKRYSCPALSESDKAAIIDGTKAIYVWGEILYRDAFGIQRYTRYRKLQGGIHGFNGESLANAEEGNEAN